MWITILELVLPFLMMFLQAFLGVASLTGLTPGQRQDLARACKRCQEIVDQGIRLGLTQDEIDASEASVKP